MYFCISASDYPKMKGSPTISIQNIPKDRLMGDESSPFWLLLLQCRLNPEKFHDGKMLYELVLPYFANGPLGEGPLGDPVRF